MMDLSKNPFYNPLDHSQIEFIATDLASINESVTESNHRREQRDEPSDKSHSVSHSINGNDPLFGSRRGSATMSELIFSSMSRTQTAGSSKEDEYALSRMSTNGSLSSNVVDRIRYKIVLKLNSREKNLIRESWSMILNEDMQSNSLPTMNAKHLGKQVPSIKNLAPINSSANVSRRGSLTSIKSANNVPDTKGNVQSNAFASSLFCSQFYANLLSMDPGLERMFPSTRHQAVAFAGVLTTAIKNLEHLQVLENYLSGLGKRHSRILGIEPPHFELMGVAFLKTLQDRFGVHCTVELEEAWSRLYSYLANSILQFGIDPVLHIDLDQEEFIFPVPNLIEGTSRTVSRLNSHVTMAESRSITTDHTSRERTNQAHKEKVADTTSTKKALFAHSVPSKKGRQPGSRNKASNNRPKTNKATPKLTSSSNQACIIM